MTERRIRVHPTPEAIATIVADELVVKIAATLAVQEAFSLVLAGGSTPKLLYEKLAEPARAEAVDWRHVEIFFGDERCVPPEHAESNYRMAREALLSKVALPLDNIVRMRGEIDPNDAAREYGEALRNRFGDAGPDVVLLGMGDDGHTASLFPHTTALKEMKHRCVANHVEKLNAWRLTMTAPFINRAREVHFMVTGAGKAERLAEVLEGPADAERLPSQLIAPGQGTLTFHLDVAAAGM